MSQSTFKRKAHVAYFQRCLTALPAQAQGHDSNRITIGYFCLSGLALLGALDDERLQSRREEWVEWVWGLQAPEGGFRGSTFLTPIDVNGTEPSLSTSNPAHIPSTYTALLVLGLLRADLSRLNVDGLHSFLRSCQETDGSFSPLPIPSMEIGRPPSFQSDARMAYCVSVVLDIIGGGDSRQPKETVSSIDKTRLITWLQSCQTWEGGFGARPGLEAQGGTSYCCIASLKLLGEPSNGDVHASASRYLSHRQVFGGSGGFQGRPGKDEDVCYSFWCGAGLRLLMEEVMFDQAAKRQALLDSQSPIGGFGKAQGEFPDPFHSYLAIAALAMLDNDPAMAESPAARLGLSALDAAWNIDKDTKAWLDAEMRRTRGADDG